LDPRHQLDDVGVDARVVRLGTELGHPETDDAVLRPTVARLHNTIQQDAQLSPRDRAMRRVS